jgi:hypothetical protein
MKKAIEKIEQAKDVLKQIHLITGESDLYAEVTSYLYDAIAALQAPPRFYAPEQREQRTGEPWHDDWAVYYRNPIDGKWYAMSFADAKKRVGGRAWILNSVVVCATEAGPPPDDWRPEE